MKRAFVALLLAVLALSEISVALAQPAPAAQTEAAQTETAQTEAAQTETAQNLATQNLAVPDLAQPAPASPAADTVATEFVLANYRNPESVELTVLVPENDTTATEAHVGLYAFAGQEKIIGTEILHSYDFKLTAGNNTLSLNNVAGLAAGRYIAVISIAGKEYRRMLRIDRIPEIQAPDGPIAAPHKIYFTPDRYLFEKRKNLVIRLFEPEVTEVYCTQQSDDPNAFSSDGAGIRRINGKYYLTVREHNYEKGTLFSEDMHIVCLESDSPTGPYHKVAALPEGDAEDTFAPLKGTHILFEGELEKRRYELYDPARHGTYELNDIRVRRHLWGDYDYGFGPSQERTLWVVAKTSTGDEVFLRNKPLYVDMSNYPAGFFDDGFNTNDNFGNSWLSADGKTLYSLHGQTVHRFYPYDSQYDVLPNSNRYQTLYSTQDGITWKYEHVTLPVYFQSEQHYGSNSCILEDSDLYILEVMGYDHKRQQIYCDLGYSRDRLHYYRFEESPYLSRFDYGSPFYSEYFITSDFMQEGNFWFRTCCGSPDPHNMAEPILLAEKLSDIDTDEIHRIFDNRNFEEIDYFEECGGYEGFAEDSRNAHYSVGIIKMRAEGWFGIDAKERKGTFTTREIRSGATKLYANACVEKGGFMKVKVLTPKGRTVNSVKVTGDDIKKEICTLPEGNYKIKVVMKKARLYTFTLE